MRELLPEAWRWFSTTVQFSSARHDDDSLSVLAGSLLQRYERALQTRDAVHLALNQRQTNDTQDAALAGLDVILLLLMSAMDVSARVAHRILDLKTKHTDAGWQRRDFLNAVAKVAPELSAVVRPGSSNFYVLEILRLLRNTVHGGALQGLAFQPSHRVIHSLVGVPPDATQPVAAAMDALGGLDKWGAIEVREDTIHLDPGAFDCGWLGSKQRGSEHPGSATTIQIGTRPYSPILGRFLRIDPIEGGSCSDYDYVCGDVINVFDLPGLCTRWDLVCNAAKALKDQVVRAAHQARSFFKHITSSAQSALDRSCGPLPTRRDTGQDLASGRRGHQMWADPSSGREARKFHLTNHPIAPRPIETSQLKRTSGNGFGAWLRRLALRPLGGDPAHKDSGVDNTLNAFVLGDVEGAVVGGFSLLSWLRRRLRRPATAHDEVDEADVASDT